MHNYSSTRRLRAGVLGYSGYSGAELLDLLQKHPLIEPVLLSHRKAEDTAAAGTPVVCGQATKPLMSLPWSQSVLSENNIKAVFTATPPEVSMEVAPQVLQQGARMIDLSGAFRLSAQQYQRWYGAEHQHPELLNDAVYGLPELHREKIR